MFLGFKYCFWQLSKIYIYFFYLNVNLNVKPDSMVSKILLNGCQHARESARSDGEGLDSFYCCLNVSGYKCVGFSHRSCVQYELDSFDEPIAIPQTILSLVVLIFRY